MHGSLHIMHLVYAHLRFEFLYDIYDQLRFYLSYIYLFIIYYTFIFISIYYLLYFLYWDFRIVKSLLSIIYLNIFVLRHIQYSLDSILLMRLISVLNDIFVFWGLPNDNSISVTTQ